MELDSRVDDDLNLMMNNLALLESAGLSNKQQNWTNVLKSALTHFLELYRQGIRDVEFEMAANTYRYDLKLGFGTMGICLSMLEKPDTSDTLTTTQLQCIENLMDTRQRLMRIFETWLIANSGRP